jgi:O-antigen ligase
MTRLRPYVATILVTLPFTSGLTLPAGFPLKAYELVGALAIVVLVAAHRVRLGRSRPVVWLALVFLAGSFVSSLAGLLLLGRLNLAPLAWATGRFEPHLAAATNLAYLAFVVGLLVLFVHALHVGVLTLGRFVRLWLWGAVAAVLYAVALNLVHVAGLPPALLGYTAPLQTLTLAGVTIVRSGPFLEGNYLGLYLVVSTSLALWAIRHHPTERWYRGVLPLLLVGTALSAAPIAWLATGGLIAVAALDRHFPRGFRTSAAVGLVLLLVAGLATDLVRVQFLDKLSLVLTGGIADHRNVSLIQRANESYKAWLMFQDHPWLGIGVGNYGYLAGHYPELFTWLQVDTLQVRRIPNNIYLEVLGEQGILTAGVFLALHLLVLRQLWRRRQGLLVAGFAAVMAYYLAFPTYTVAFLWVWLAFAVHVGRPPGDDPVAGRPGADGSTGTATVRHAPS